MKKRLRITFNSPAVLGFVLACLLVTALGVMTGEKMTRMFFMSYHTSFKDPLMYVRLFIHVLGHSGWDHFLANATYLLLIGTMLEEKYGSKLIIEIIVITALATGLINNIFFTNVALCGASGVVFAFILLASFTGFRAKEIPLTFILIAIIFLGQQVYEAVMVHDDISNMAHIVGGIVGATIGYEINKR